MPDVSRVDLLNGDTTVFKPPSLAEEDGSTTLMLVSLMITLLFVSSVDILSLLLSFSSFECLSDLDSVKVDFFIRFRIEYVDLESGKLEAGVGESGASVCFSQLGLGWQE
jgi:hypothetical protein